MKFSSTFSKFGLSVCLLIVNTTVWAQENNNTDIGSQTMQQANYALQAWQDLNKASQQLLQQSNRLRQELLQARSKATNPELNRRARQVAQEMSALQQQGSVLRLQANNKYAQALTEFKHGLQQLWPTVTATSEPFTANNSLNTEGLTVTAHNTPERSVHPNMQDMGGPPQTNTPEKMSLALNQLAGQNFPDNIDRGIFQLSRDKQYFGHIEAIDAAKGQHAIPINTIHRWRLVVSDLQGRGLENAEIEFTGHMPGHVHGLPTQPHITALDSPGLFSVTGVKFQMLGWWVIDLIIRVDGKEDVLRFNLVL